MRQGSWYDLFRLQIVLFISYLSGIDTKSFTSGYHVVIFFSYLSWLSQPAPPRKRTKRQLLPCLEKV